jgi:hypothetical protein
VARSAASPDAAGGNLGTLNTQPALPTELQLLQLAFDRSACCWAIQSTASFLVSNVLGAFELLPSGSVSRTFQRTLGSFLTLP